MNPNFIYGASNYTGVGWWVYISANHGTIYSPICAVSPRHLVCAAHALAGPGKVVHFIDSNGTQVDRTVGSFGVVENDAMENSDLCVVTLTSPLPATVAHYPWHNLAGGDAAYQGQSLIVLGQNPNGTPRAGEAILTGFDDEDGPIVEGTYDVTWTYNSALAPVNACALSPGDSGGPSFSLVGGKPALVGTHHAAGTTGLVTTSFDTLLSHYVTKVDAILAPAGHRLARATFTATTLAIPSSASSPTTLRRLNPGSVNFSVANVGAALTGNLAVTLTFPAGHQPDSISAPGAVVEATGSGSWELRKATLDAGTSLAFTASWTALPDLPSISVDLSAGSDTAATVDASPSFTLAPSYAEWADGLTQPGQTEDPDQDTLENLLEYAFGGDPESGLMRLPGDHPLVPVMTESGGTVSISFPERDDAVLRGLSYVIETSGMMEVSSWLPGLPPGAASSAAPFAPAVPGFVQRTVSWPAAPPAGFARVRVELAE
nr:trypsin-like peptidase domain-containing protein [Luteolibacter marinus]